ncbi:MAG: hypothetical protein SF172_16155 [Burkholderiales bacterium]|nr:hypothetical protein [Burkholderiales bacterium]
MKRAARAKNPPIPDITDWGLVNQADLDAAHAYTQFFGVSHDQAVAKFRKNAFFYQEDLCSMPLVPFAFYVKAYMDYLASPHSAGDSDGASCFFHVVEEALRLWPSELSHSLLEQLITTGELVASKQQFFDASEDIYGSFAARLLSIREQLAKLGHELRTSK